jgi:hypothetical protein
MNDQRILKDSKYKFIVNLNKVSNTAETQTSKVLLKNVYAYWKNKKNDNIFLGCEIYVELI